MLLRRLYIQIVILLVVYIYGKEGSRNVFGYYVGISFLVVLNMNLSLINMVIDYCRHLFTFLGK